MDAHTVVDEWETSPFDGGLEEAARMARRGFSGALQTGSDWLFVADGDPVAAVAEFESGPTPGDVDAFDDASGQVHEAPHPSAAKLAPMLALDGEVRGEYFSDDTPIGTVHDTLAEGDFTGYVELAENVLSGDYYVVFEAGEAEYIAFIGSTERLVTGSEAESKIKNEVGIYSVTAVGLPAVELPDPPEPANGAGGGVDHGSTADTTDPDTADTTDPDTADTTDPDTPIGVGASDAATPIAESDDESVVDPDAAAGADDAEPVPGDEAAPSTGPAEDDVAGEEARTIPSLDPDQSGRGGDDAGPADTEAVGSTEESETSTGTADADPADAGAASGPTASGGAAGRQAAGASSDALDALRGDLEELRSSMEALEGRVRALESADGGATPTRTDGPSLSPTEALSKTTLFVREGTSGGPTLEDVHDGRADRDALASNVGLERHTRFDEQGATVDGEPYESFLESSQAYEFVRWLTTDLLFEIRVTGSQAPMSHLYDALPEIDRVFFDESVSVEGDGEAREVTFDVVVRDRNGAPLFVAVLEERREPTARPVIESLVTDASDLGAANGSVAGAFAVTASYFEPEALDVAQEATTSSLLSREKYRSYVNLTRKNGFHLCLVEARDASLHLTLPEL